MLPSRTSQDWPLSRSEKVCRLIHLFRQDADAANQLLCTRSPPDECAQARGASMASLCDEAADTEVDEKVRHSRKSCPAASSKPTGQSNTVELDDCANCTVSMHEGAVGSVALGSLSSAAFSGSFGEAERSVPLEPNLKSAMQLQTQKMATRDLIRASARPKYIKNFDSALADKEPKDINDDSPRSSEFATPISTPRALYQRTSAASRALSLDSSSFKQRVEAQLHDSDVALGCRRKLGRATSARRMRVDERHSIDNMDPRLICSAARHGRHRQVEAALAAGFDPNYSDAFGNTLFHMACQNGNKRIAKLAIKWGGDMDAQNEKGNTGLHFLFAYGYSDVAEYFISKGANNQIRNSLGLPPCHGLR
eukprot:TRINITY_DN22253_c1_g1_i1.p1 TRINITY_DN22253_c1_g1~~TRINITY_DN22253_c1_g1_i1.p1  ORF type:complete len:366 (+),score=62.34 TRINITY_DN22253_c1_g1_i1:173-1270(+)